METKRRTYVTYILPSVLYATETITWNQSLLLKLQTFENHIMRWMCNIKLNDRVRIQRLRSLTKLPSIIKTVKVRKLKYFGHLKRSRNPVKHVFEGMVEGARRRGRPQRRWREDIFDWTNLTMQQINVAVNDRQLWRTICHDPS